MGDPIKKLLDLISHKESVSGAKKHGYKSGYDVPVGFDILKSDKPLSEMTIKEVREFQKKLKNATKGKIESLGKNKGSSAVGQYQILQKTLTDAQKKLGFSDDDIFTPELQDRIASDFLLERRGYSDYKSGKLSADDFQNNLAKEWASLPTTEGKSHYSGQPSITSDSLQTILKEVIGNDPVVKTPTKSNTSYSTPNMPPNPNVDALPEVKLPKAANGMNLSFLKGLEGFGAVANQISGPLNIMTKMLQTQQAIGQNSKDIKSAIIPNIKQDTNPYYKEGGAFQTNGTTEFKGPSHDNGGIPIDQAGNPNQVNPVAEVEGNEKMYEYSRLPEKKGNQYIFPKNMKKSFENIEKMFKDKDQDPIAQNTKEMMLSKLETKNELKKAKKQEKLAKLASMLNMGGQEQQAPQEGQPMMKNGGDLPKYNGGGTFPTIDPLAALGPQNGFNLNLNNMMNNSLANTADYQKTHQNEYLNNRENTHKNTDRIANIEALSRGKSLFQNISGLIGSTPQARIDNENIPEIERLTKETLRYDNSALKEGIMRNQAAFKEILRNSNRGQGTMNANLVNAYSQTGTKLAELEYDKQNQLAKRKIDASQILDSTGRQIQAEGQRKQITDQQNKAAAFNITGQSFQDQIEIEKTLNNIDVTTAQGQQAVALLAQKYADFGIDTELWERAASGDKEAMDKIGQLIKYKG